MPEPVIDHHICIVLIAVGAVGEINHIRGRASGGAHIDFKADNLSFFSKICVIFCQPEKFQMDKTAAHPERFQTGASAGF